MYKKIAALACSVAVAGIILGTPLASLAAGKTTSAPITASRLASGGPGKAPVRRAAPPRGHQAPPAPPRHHHHHSKGDTLAAGGAGLLLGVVIGSAASGK